MKRYFYTLLHLFYPAGIEESISNVQPYNKAVALTARENNQMNKKLVLTVLIALVTLTLAACAPHTTTKPVPPEEGTAYAAEVDEIVENMIVGFTKNDFAKMTRDMVSPLDEDYEASIRQFASETIGEWGAYQGKTLDHVEDRGGWRVVDLSPRF